ncbi:hypothetical protein [Glutamicibacter sp. JC586]|uniref:hypothetical protein n=1 Tax=Glutamicibacter sp. JC586 TaxID=2590552 RepID=UPI00190F7AB4|nr:hypothetical protein [Glutamicibacter sp. JC586]
MAEPRIGFGTMPMLGSGGNPNYSPRFHADWLLAFGLVPAGSGGADQDLVATSVGTVVDMLVVPATGLKADVVQWHTAIGKWSQVALPSEILRVGIVWFTQCKGLIRVLVHLFTLGIATLFWGGSAGTPMNTTPVRCS